MEPLERFVLQHRSVGRDEFMRAHPFPVLLVRVPKGFAPDFGEFGTLSAVSERPFESDPNDMRLASKMEGLSVLIITKSALNPPRDPVVLGRSHENDVVLPHKTVSRVHARFEKKDDGTLFVTDLGSRNGTCVNDVRLEAQRPVQLNSGDAAKFGAAATTFYLADSFAGYLGELLDTSSG
ncbi:FHA domain-containing protein [Myxococcota bacterium]